MGELRKSQADTEPLTDGPQVMGPTPERVMLDQALANMFTVERWAEDGEDGLTAHINGTFTVLDDDDEAGLCSGDSGKLSACVVGTAEYGNQRVMFWFVNADYDYGDGNEVRDLSTLDHS